MRGLKFSMNFPPNVRFSPLTGLPIREEVQEIRSDINSSKTGTVENVIDMYICEIPHLILKVEQLYRFRTKVGCRKCEEYVSKQ